MSGETLVLWATVIQLKLFHHMQPTTVQTLSLQTHLHHLGWETTAHLVEGLKRVCLMLSDKVGIW